MTSKIRLPDLGGEMTEARITKWLVQAGDAVTSGDLIAEVEAGTVTLDLEAETDGIVEHITVAAGADPVAVGTVLAVLQDATKPERIKVSPVARKLAEERGISLSQVTGSGPDGRIVRADIDAVAGSSRTVERPAVAEATPPRAIPAAPDLRALSARPHRDQPLDAMRRTIASRLSDAKQTVPHVYLRRDITLDPLLASRAQIAARGVSLSVTDFLVKACALALQEVPATNAVWAGDHIKHLQHSDIAVAVAVKGGIYTPVIEEAERKSLPDISAELSDLVAKARAHQLPPEAYQGGSFTVSNLGPMGIDSFDAIINPPHSGMLAVGAGSKRPVVAEDGSLRTATVMTLSLSVDHRVIDGAEGAALLAAIKQHLECPAGLLV
ncbi:dihydrolipoamide acetyltransferase family protein [Sagittula sp. SSi028]|uniref:dihydrolipoamide acetyltransferase family protein n=1 Tax=Sagittula sp. SSi028 TaxID=3400636 RepID=UPI003AF4FFC6